jgi:hypothetical protein
VPSNINRYSGVPDHQPEWQLNREINLNPWGFPVNLLPDIVAAGDFGLVLHFYAVQMEVAPNLTWYVLSCQSGGPISLRYAQHEGRRTPSGGMVAHYFQTDPCRLERLQKGDIGDRVSAIRDRRNKNSPRL